MKRMPMGRIRLLTLALAAFAACAIYGAPQLVAQSHDTVASVTTAHRHARHRRRGPAQRTVRLERSRHERRQRTTPSRTARNRETRARLVRTRASRRPERPVREGSARMRTRRVTERRVVNRRIENQRVEERRIADRRVVGRRVVEQPVEAQRIARRAAPVPPAAAPVLSSTPVDALPEDALWSHGRLLMPPPLRGSRASLLRQNERDDAEGLERILNDDDLNNRIAHGFLVPLPVSTALTVNPQLPENRRYCRPWTAQFLADLSRAFAAEFHSPLQVNSAVRTVAFQEHLERINGNAAPAEGDLASSHLSGATIDIAKKGLSLPEIAWMRIQLLHLEDVGKIDVEEEFEQACFHIAVYTSYAPSLDHREPAPPSTAQLTSGSTPTGF